MNAAISNTGFEGFSVPARAASQSLQPMPKIDDPDEDVHFLRVLDRIDHFPVPLPLPETRLPVLDVDRMVVSTSLVRRIEHELKHDECDPRTVINSCRGLARGSLEFENAYIAARIRSFAKHQRKPVNPLLCTQSIAGDPLQISSQTAINPQTPPLPHPMAVIHPGHLMSHLGIWVIALLGTQAWASWRVSGFADTYLEGGRPFYSAIALVLMLALDSAVWFRRRGRLCDDFLVPGAVLFLMALLPIFILHVRDILLATD
jgi:hypothetical protein